LVGRGIPKDDFSLVCERFCTSKLHDFQDLKTIATYGFRGEALASVSHVAHVTVVSRTKDSPCAYKGVYSDGALIPQGNASNKKKPVKQDGSQKPVEPKPIAGNIGTQITVDDLFYNLPIRKAAFKNHQEEYIRILGVVQKYAILNAGVAFSCKKYGSHQSDLQTLEKGTQLDNIRNIYGESIANELLKFDHESDKSKKYTFSANGFLSNPNFSIKKKEFIIFINNRLIECPAIRKCIDTVYSKFLPKSGSYSFVFISLSIPPESIDVNVHPTKKHVHFYHEDDVVLELTSTIDAVLTNNDQSRVFTVSVRLSFYFQCTYLRNPCLYQANL
jgi:DNA mismatch repair protein MLH1